MSISEELYRVGRESPLTTEDRNTILEAACEITILQSQLSEIRQDLAEAFRHCDEYSQIIKGHLNRLSKIHGD